MRKRNRLNLNKISRRKQRQKRKKLYTFLKVAGIAFGLLIVLYLGYFTAGVVYKKMTNNTVTPENITSEGGTVTATPEDKMKNVKTVSLYIPSQKITDGQYLNIISDAKSKGFNNIILEIKDSEGNIYFETSNETALNSGAVSSKAVDLNEIEKNVKNLGMTLSVKLCAFKDNIMPSYVQKAAVCINEGTTWLDSNYKRWINPYSVEGTEYISSLCSEISSKYKVSEIILSNVSFVSNGKTYLINYEKTPQAISKEDTLVNFVKSVKKGLNGDIKLGIIEDGYYLYNNFTDEKSGLSKKVMLSGDICYPFLNPSLVQSHTPIVTGEININNAEENLYNTVYQLYKSCVKNNNTQCYIKPVIQGFNLNGRNLTADDIQNQTKALNDNNQKYYVVYSIDGNINFGLFK